MKRNEYEMMVRAQLELDHIPQVVEDRLRQVYAELPEQGEGSKCPFVMPPWLKRACATAASLVVVCGALLGLNGVNPALAESLPFIGGVFESFNRGVSGNNLWQTQAGLANYAVSAGEDSVQVPAGGLGQKPFTISVDQVYYDGVYVYAGLVMDLDAGPTIYTDPWGDYYNVLINGEPQLSLDTENGGHKTAQGFNETTAYGWWQQVENGKYISQQGFRVPEKYQDQDSLEITLCCQGVEEYLSDPETEGKYIGTQQLNNTPYQLSFTVEKNQAQVRRIEGELEQNGITFVSAEAGPAGSTFVFDVAGQYDNPVQILRFDDGRELGVAGAGHTEELENGGERQTWMMGGIQPGETRKVVLGIFDKNDTKDWLAVFLIDFESGTVEAGTVEDIKPTPSVSYVCGVEAVESLREGWLVADFNYNVGKNSLFVLTPEEYRDLKVEVWQDGRLVDSAETRRDEFHWEEGSTFYSEYTQQPDGSWTETYLNDLPLNRYFLTFKELWDLNEDRPATVKIIDRATGETLVEQFMQWNQPNTSDPAVTIHHRRNEQVDSIVDETGDGAVSSQAE